MLEFAIDVVIELFWWAFDNGRDKRLERRERRRARKAERTVHE